MIKKRIELEIEESEQKSFSTVLDGFVDNFLSQADLLPPKFEPVMSRSRFITLLSQINHLNRESKIAIDPNEIITLALNNLDKKRAEMGDKVQMHCQKKDYLDFLEYLSVFSTFIKFSHTVKDPKDGTLVFKNKVSAKNLFDTIQIVTYEYQQEDLNQIYFMIIDFLKTQHNVAFSDGSESIT